MKGTERAPEDRDRSVLRNVSLFSLRLWVMPVTIHSSWRSLDGLSSRRPVFDMGFMMESGTLKADSHIACRAHAAPMPFPCHVVPLRV